MKPRTWSLFGFTGLCVVILVFACGRQQAPTGASGVVTSLFIRIAGPLTRVGQTAQLTAFEALSSGSATDVTAAAVWGSSNANVVTVSPTGTATVVGVGTATITVSIASVSRTGSVIVNTAVALTGTVVEPGFLGIPNAEVALVGGAMDGQTTTADRDGYYSFDNPGTATQVRATKDGYITSTVNIAATGVTNITLNPAAPYADVGGTYQITLMASPSCHLAGNRNTRTYSAPLTQDGALLTVVFSGPQFSPPTNMMVGRIYGNSVKLKMGGAGDNAQWYEQGFTENLGNGQVVTLNGTASGGVVGSAIETELAGAVTLPGSPTCTAADHRLTFSR